MVKHILTWMFAVVALFGQSCTFVMDDCDCKGTCPDGWIQFKGSCYYLFENKQVNWVEAKHHCEIHRSQLVTIETQEEDYFLRAEFLRLNLPIPSSNEFWIDTTDAGTEGTWIWESVNAPLTYTDWYPGQPGNDGQDEDCAVIAASTAFIGWHDAPCKALHHPICEIKFGAEVTDIIGKK